ncbi:36.4 kDa proline-rich protein-like [Lotus japonicus]|uniref:36.4 kDa proline-rich protein-like n=1 Tax=Lotus japonicus TaxID=34305 RepID=UPI00258CEE51|nr:36.4 kDa proline-rich protein-like [Lotus japonicus]
MSWFLVVLFLSLTFGNPTEAIHDKKPPSAVVVGTVYCDTCFQQDFSMGSHFISGASVAVECKDGDGSSNSSFKKEVKTDEHGKFRVHLPFSVSKHVKRIKRCSVKLISSSEPYCAVASAATSSSLHLKSRKQGLHIFSAGFFSFKPLKQPTLCNQKPRVQKGADFVIKSFPPNIDPSFPPPLQDPNTPGGVPFLPPNTLPGLPGLPQLPGLPPLPPLPGIPIPGSPPKLSKQASPGHMTKTSDKNEPSDIKVVHPETFIFPPNPLQPPIVPNPLQPPIVPNPLQPPPLVPNPLQPPTPPLIPNPLQPPTPPLIPNPLQPPPSGPSPFFPFPPVPGFTPPSPPPVSPFPFLPLFPPPGSPPASSP